MLHKKKLRITVEEGVYADTTYNYDSTSYTIDWIDSPFDIGSASATLVIEWGDGITQTINNYSGQWLSHNYPSSSVGTYVYPTTTLTFDDSNGDVQQLEDGNIVNGGASISFYVNYACANAEIAQWSSQESGIWKMTTKIWITDNFFGNHIGSYTHAWKKKNNGNWERHKADIWCEVNGVFRNNDCIQQSTKTGSKYRHLFKKVQKTKTKLFKHYDISNGDINSGHYMIKGNLTLQLGMVINPC